MNRRLSNALCRDNRYFSVRFESTIHNRHRMRVSYNGELPPKLRHRLKRRVTSEFRQPRE